MFGVDLGITVSSVFFTNEKNELLGDTILFGDRSIKDDWIRVTEMASAIVTAITDMAKSNPGMVVQPLVSIEEPIFSAKVRNPKVHLNLSSLYCLVRYKLSKRHYEIYSIHPISVKTTAKNLAFRRANRNIRLKKELAVRGKLTKTGMVRAYVKVMGTEPNYHTKQGRETLADSFFIARTGMNRRKAGISANSRGSV